MPELSPSRLSGLLRWIGGVLVLVLALELLAVLSANAWGEEAFSQLVVDTLIKGSPMALVGLLLMLVGSRLDQPQQLRSPLRWTVFGVGIALALSLLVAVPVTISGNAILQKQADQAVSQKQMELERAQAESNNPQLIEALVGQLRQAGQLDPNLSDELASGQAKRFIDGRLGQLKQQVQQAERARSLTLGQRRFSGTGVALLLALATAAVAMAAILSGAPLWLSCISDLLLNSLGADPPQTRTARKCAVATRPQERPDRGFAGGDSPGNHDLVIHFGDPFCGEFPHLGAETIQPFQYP